MPNPLPEVRAMIDRFVKVAKECGFNVERAVVAPGEPDVLEVIMSVDSSLFADPEQRAFDAQFAELEQQLRVETQNEKNQQVADKARTDLESWLEDD